jgi:hypothetical protein
VADHEERYAETVARLSRVRGTMTDDQFDRLVADVIRMQARFIEINRNRVHLPPSARKPPGA